MTVAQDSGRSAAAGVRSLMLDDLPLLVVALPASPEADHVWRALHDAGLHALPSFTGVTFPRGARVGVQIEGAEARVIDEEDRTLLRMPREGLDGLWRAAALRLRGTMLGVVTDLDVAAIVDPRVLAVALDAQASSRPAGLLGAIVGVHEQRQRLPLLF
jgi:hypothetical protein